MSDRYSYICRVCYKNGEEYDEYFDSEEEATEYAENWGGDPELVDGFDIIRVDWYWHCDQSINYMSMW